MNLTRHYRVHDDVTLTVSSPDAELHGMLGARFGLPALAPSRHRLRIRDRQVRNVGHHVVQGPPSWARRILPDEGDVQVWSDDRTGRLHLVVGDGIRAVIDPDSGSGEASVATARSAARAFVAGPLVDALLGTLGVSVVPGHPPL